MEDTNINDIIGRLNKMSPEKRNQVIQSFHYLLSGFEHSYPDEQTKGNQISNVDWSQFSKDFTKEEIDEFAKNIEEGCEKIEDTW